MLKESESPSLTAEQTSLFNHLFTNDIPLLDLRSPTEFAKGAFPTSSNIPLMTDEERAKVGTEYKRHGQDAAIELGHKLVSGASKDKLIQQWSAFKQANPSSYLYCFRGGLRSHTVQSWLSSEEIDMPLVEGGYKAMRRFLIDQMAQVVAEKKWLVIGGRTGTAKTTFLQQWRHHIDLEGLANHRGSSFGRRATEQPTVINFENKIAIDLLNKHPTTNTFVVEDEGVVIGRCSIPLALRDTMKQSPILLLEKPFDERVETILNDYVLDLSQEYLRQFPQDGIDRYHQAMLSALSRIKKRLGGKRYQEINQLLESALNNDSLSLHRDWISRLLHDYYDPMYDYQLENKNSRVIVSGDQQTLTEYLLAQGLEIG